jgi:two-component system, OmpR family, alkaline phosphatase synthesis response regulator PhoP
MNATRVVIIEDQAKIAHWLKAFLEQAGFQVASAPDGRSGLDLVWREKPDVILLDLMLPDMDGFDVCRTIRQRSDAFVIMITARAEETDRLVGLEIGADDYIIKPFSPKEVVARIRVLLRRANGLLATRPSQANQLKHANLVLDIDKHTCTLGGSEIALTPTEFDILRVMMNKPGVPFTRERLISEALGYDYVGYERTIDVHIRNLRRKLEADGEPQYIQTVFGIGYRFADDVADGVGEAP